jgi:hypothetical protein
MAARSAQLPAYQVDAGEKRPAWHTPSGGLGRDVERPPGTSCRRLAPNRLQVSPSPDRSHGGPGGPHRRPHSRRPHTPQRRRTVREVGTLAGSDWQDLTAKVDLSWRRRRRWVRSRRKRGPSTGRHPNRSRGRPARTVRSPPHTRRPLTFMEARARGDVVEEIWRSRRSSPTANPSCDLHDGRRLAPGDSRYERRHGKTALRRSASDVHAPDATWSPPRARQHNRADAARSGSRGFGMDCVRGGHG